MTSETASSIVCTLTTADRRSQELEWTDVAARALSSVEIDGGIALTLPVTDKACVADLVQRERACCGTWLTIEDEYTSNAIRLRLTADNPQGISIIRAFAGSTTP